MLIKPINSSIRICVIDDTVLKSWSLYDAEARPHLGRYKGYKLHYAACVFDNILPLSFPVTTSNIYDNEVPKSLYQLKIYNSLNTLADAAYNDAQCFEASKALKYDLLTDEDMRKVKNIDHL